MEKERDTPIVDLMSVTLQKIKDMVDVNTIVGQTITAPDGTTIIPVSKLSFGFGSGGSDFMNKPQQTQANFGGGSAAGVNITPVAFLVVSNGTVRLFPVNPPASNTVDRIVEIVPTVVDKIGNFFQKDEDEQEPKDSQSSEYDPI
ncbi:GerW family sporulation protein [Oscillospiraceae bacterium OttesenSCG-928-G22]|nr:GerW family sporulation protein [Oscillospiraceae bacterium OttesenSCG-928-G22]